MPLSDTLNPDAASDLSPSGPYRALKQFGLVLLCAAWIVLGLFGHDPWKPDDAISFGIAYDMLAHGDWIVRSSPGRRSRSARPCSMSPRRRIGTRLGGALALHDAARVAVALCLGLTLWLLALTGRELYGRVSLVAGAALCRLRRPGTATSAHARAGLLVADALAMFAPALALRGPAVGGMLLGLAAGVAFLCRGPLGPALIGATALLLAFFAPWRNRQYITTLALAAIVALPLIVAWPLALYLRSPELFAQWLEAQNIARFFGLIPDSPQAERLYYLKNLPWLAWPALPLVLWTLWIRGRGYNGGLATAGIELPAVAFVVTLVVLSAAAEPRASLAMPMLLPLALLGRGGSRYPEARLLRRARPVPASSLLACWQSCFGPLAGVPVRHGLPEPVAKMFRDTQPGSSRPGNGSR
jgi:4-amino-4-deoxy-L-arabinose transferase-like glycosyltransferase